MNTVTPPIGYYGDINGMSRAVPAHLLQEGVWFNTFNFQFRNGKIKQTAPEDAFLRYTDGSIAQGYTCLAAFVIDGTDTIVVGLGGEAAVQFDFDVETATDITLPGAITPDEFNFMRWQSVTFGEKLYFGNQNTEVLQYDGTTASVVIATGPKYQPKYMEVYYEHLVLANVVDTGTTYALRVAYSDKGDFTDFDPLTTNEADFFDLDTNELNALYGYGITGMKKIGDQIAIHTPGSIWTMRYVGFENGVMEFAERIHGMGCWLPYALIGFDRFHIFPSRDDFYLFDGAVCQSIGQDIKDFWYNDLTENPQLRQRTWGHFDAVNQELRWYYVSRSSEDLCDKCLVYNWPRKAWYVETSFGRSCALSAGYNTTRTIDGLAFLSSDIDSLTSLATTIDGLASSELLPKTIFGRYENLNLYYDLDQSTFGAETYFGESYSSSIPSGTSYKYIDSLFVPAPADTMTILKDSLGNYSEYLGPHPTDPYSFKISITDQSPFGVINLVQAPGSSWPVGSLESRDFDFRSKTDIKDIQSLFLDTSLPHIQEDFGVEVYISSRRFLHEDVEFKFYGLWVNDTFTERMGKPATAGRIIRFKFVTRRLAYTQFFGFAPFVYAGTSER